MSQRVAYPIPQLTERSPFATNESNILYETPAPRQNLSPGAQLDTTAVHAADPVFNE